MNNTVKLGHHKKGIDQHLTLSSCKTEAQKVLFHNQLYYAAKTVGMLYLMCY